MNELCLKWVKMQYSYVIMSKGCFGDLIVEEGSGAGLFYCDARASAVTPHASTTARVE